MFGLHLASSVVYAGGQRQSNAKAKSTAHGPTSRSRTPVKPRPSGPEAKAPFQGQPLPRSQSCLQPLRKDAPGRQDGGRGRLPEWQGEEHQQRALGALAAGIHATSNAPTHTSHITTITVALRSWGHTEIYPITVAKIQALGATLKEGGYRSAQAFFVSWRTEAERLGYDVGSCLRRHMTDSVRSCMRGLGGPVRARPLPMDSLHLLPFGEDPVTKGGPLNPFGAISAGAWWLCREVELSTARARMVELSKDNFGVLIAKWHLPASKTDVEALGIARSHVCSCSTPPPWGSTGQRTCPAHIVMEQLLLLRRRFPDRFDADRLPDWDLPLFPTADGQVVQKEAMVRTIEAAADALGIPRESPDSSERISGHSLRVTGAQGLIGVGWHLWAIQLMGRWGSDTIKKYIREAPILHRPNALETTSIPSKPVDLDSLVAAIRGRPGMALRASSDVTPHASAPQPEVVDMLGDVVASEPSAPSTSSSSSPCASTELKAEHLVVNLARHSGFTHRIRDSASERAVCGWKFRAGAHASIPTLADGPLYWGSCCERCFEGIFPEAREAAPSDVVPWRRSA